MTGYMVVCRHTWYWREAESSTPWSATTGKRVRCKAWWASETSKPMPSDTLPPEKTHLFQQDHIPPNRAAPDKPMGPFSFNLLQSLCLGLVGQYKVNSMIFCGQFTSFCSILAYFIAILLLCFYFYLSGFFMFVTFFLFVLRKKGREYKVERVGRYGGFGRRWKEETQ